MSSKFWAIVIALSVSVQAFADSKVSILWVVDNGGDMSDQRTMLSRSFPFFLRHLQANGPVDFKMAVTTTDYFGQRGGLVSSPEGYKIVDLASKDPAAEFQSIVNNIKESSTSFWEQGLESSFAAIMNDGDKFLTDGVPLTIVYLTNEDDYSCEADCTGVEPENNKNWKAYALDRYAKGFADLKQRQIDVSIVPIVGILEGSCTVSSYGIRYLKLRSLMGPNGPVGSVCTQEIPAALDSTAAFVNKTLVPSPVSWNVKTLMLPDALAGDAWAFDLTVFIDSSTPVSCSLVQGPAWMTVDPSCNVVGIPAMSDIGRYVASFRATDGAGNQADVQAFGVVGAHINPSNEPPVWKQEPIVLPPAKVGQNYIVDLSQFAFDPDGDRIIFRSVTGPPWAKITTSGILSGTPGRQDIGTSSLIVAITDGQDAGAMTEIPMVVTK